MTDRVEDNPSPREAQVAKKTKPKVVAQSLEMLLEAYGDETYLDQSDEVEDALSKLSQIQTDDIKNNDLSLFGTVFKFFMIECMKDSVSEKLSTQSGNLVVVTYKHANVKTAYFLLHNVLHIINQLSSEDADACSVPLTEFEWELCAAHQGIEISENISNMVRLHDLVVQKITNDVFVQVVQKSRLVQEFVSPFRAESDLEGGRKTSRKQKKDEDDEDDFEEESDEEEYDDEEGIDSELLCKKRHAAKQFDQLIEGLNEMLSLWRDILPHYIVNHVFELESEAHQNLFSRYAKSRRRIVLPLHSRLSVKYMETFVNTLCTLQSVFSSFRRYHDEILDVTLLNVDYVDGFLYKLLTIISSSKKMTFKGVKPEKYTKSQRDVNALYEKLTEKILKSRTFCQSRNKFNFYASIDTEDCVEESAESNDDQAGEKEPDRDQISHYRKYIDFLEKLQPSRRVLVTDISAKHVETAYACMQALINRNLVKDAETRLQVYDSMRKFGEIILSGSDSLPEPIELKSVSNGKSAAKSKTRKPKNTEESEEPVANPENPEPAAAGSGAPDRLTRASKEVDASRIVEGGRVKQQTTRFSTSDYKPEPRQRNKRDVHPDPFSDTRKRGEEIPGMDSLDQKGVEVIVVAAEPTKSLCKKEEYSNKRYSKRAEVGIFRVLRKCAGEDEFYEVTDKIKPEEKDIRRMHKGNLIELRPEEQKRNVVVNEEINQYDASNIDGYFIDLFQGNALFQEKDGKTYILGTHEPFSNDDSNQKISKALNLMPDLKRELKTQSDRKRVQNPSAPVSREERKRLREERAANPASKRRRTENEGKEGEKSSDEDDQSEQRAAFTTTRSKRIRSRQEDIAFDNTVTVFAQRPFQDEPVEFFHAKDLEDSGLSRRKNIAARSSLRGRAAESSERRDAVDSDSSEDDPVSSEDEGSEYDPSDETDATYRLSISDARRQTRSLADPSPFTDESEKQFYPYNPLTPCTIFFQSIGNVSGKHARVFIFPKKMRLTETLFRKIGTLLYRTGCWDAGAPFLEVNIKYNIEYRPDPLKRSIAFCDVTSIDARDVAREFLVVDSNGAFTNDLETTISDFVLSKLPCDTWSLYSLFTLCPYDSNTWAHGVSDSCMCRKGMLFKECQFRNHAANQYTDFYSSILTGIPPCYMDKALGKRLRISTPREAQCFVVARPFTEEDSEQGEVVEARAILIMEPELPSAQPVQAQEASKEESTEVPKEESKEEPTLRRSTRSSAKRS